MRGKKLFEKKPRETARIVADDTVLFEEIVEDHSVAELLQLRQINEHLLRALTPIALSNFGRNRPAVCNYPINDRARRVAADRAEVIR